MVQMQQKRVQKRKLAEVSKQETHVALENSTKQNQITEEKQSFALVQTLLLASVSLQAIRKYTTHNISNVRLQHLRLCGEHFLVRTADDWMPIP